MVWCLLEFFFSSRRRHTRYWRDWSSDVCSSDLEALVLVLAAEAPFGGAVERHRVVVVEVDEAGEREGAGERRERKSVVEGKRVDLGGRRIIKKNKLHTDSVYALCTSLVINNSLS